jgi:hypothetical protein
LRAATKSPLAIGQQTNYAGGNDFVSRGASMKTVYALAFAGLLASSPAIAQVTSMQSANPGSKGVTGKNPNRIVCEVEDTIGSRLGARKICKTVLEWQQMRSEHRESIEKIQQNSNIGKTSG